VSKETKATLGAEKLDVVADRGYFSSEEILACEEAGITVTLPKPMTSNSKAEGRFGKQDFRYVAEEDAYICPAGERLAYHYTTEENGLVLRRYWTNACQSCAIKPQLAAKADIWRTVIYVHTWHEADIQCDRIRVGFWRKSGHRADVPQRAIYEYTPVSGRWNTSTPVRGHAGRSSSMTIRPAS
jgi:hypothetical protein